MSIQVQGIRKTFGSFVAVDDVSLDFPTGQLIALLGPSGCGKTTLLRIIAGLERADKGRVLFDGRDASDRDARAARELVFQHYALFRHMSVYENVAFGLRASSRVSIVSRRRQSASVSTNCARAGSSAGSSIAIRRKLSGAPAPAIALSPGAGRGAARIAA
jgi:ABC-type sulfate/molybdate transport systems ATPase subunit